MTARFTASVTTSRTCSAGSRIGDAFKLATIDAPSRHIRFENMDYFRWLTGNFLMSDENVLSVVEKTIDLTKADGISTPMKINMAPRMIFDGGVGTA